MIRVVQHAHLLLLYFSTSVQPRIASTNRRDDCRIPTPPNLTRLVGNRLLSDRETINGNLFVF